MKRRGFQIGKFYRNRSEDSSDPSIRSSKRLNSSPSSNTSLSPKQNSPKMVVSNGGSMSKSNIHVDANSDPNFLDPEMRERQLMGRLHSLMVRLSARGAKQFEEQTMNGTSSVQSDLFKEANLLIKDLNENERFFVEEEQNEGTNVDMEMGLNEKEIMKCIKHETFESTTNKCLQKKEACSMCQVIYTNGEKLGRLDCLHKFHMECIKDWLSVKNKCPMCKRKALLPSDDDSDGDSATDFDEDDDSATAIDDGNIDNATDLDDDNGDSATW